MAARFVVTRTVTVRHPLTGRTEVIPVAGHLIGPGCKSVLTMHRRIEKDRANQQARKARGRFAWPVAA